MVRFPPAYLEWRFNKRKGVKSTARRLVDEPDRKAFDQTGFAAYRATVDVAKMKKDPEISWLLERPSLNIWYKLPLVRIRIIH